MTIDRALFASFYEEKILVQELTRHKMKLDVFGTRSINFKNGYW